MERSHAGEQFARPIFKSLGRLPPILAWAVSPTVQPTRISVTDSESPPRPEGFHLTLTINQLTNKCSAARSMSDPADEVRLSDAALIVEIFMSFLAVET